MKTVTDSPIATALASQFSDNFRLVEKRPNIYQVFSPFYFEDGDMLDMYVVPDGDTYRVCDYGKTLMRLSYSFELNTDNKLRIFSSLLSENGFEFDEASGDIFIHSPLDQLGVSVMRLSQVIAKVSRLDMLKREIVSGLFFEMVDEFIQGELAQFNPLLRAHPIEERDDLEVTCEFKIRPEPAYLFAVRGSTQARLATIAILSFQQARLPFRSYVVHDKFEALPTKDKTRITSAADKQFTTLDDFRDQAVAVLSRDAS